MTSVFASSVTLSKTIFYAQSCSFNSQLKKNNDRISSCIMALIQLYSITSNTEVVLKSLLEIQIGQGCAFKNIKWKSKTLNYKNYFVTAIHCQARVANKSYLFGFSKTMILMISVIQNDHHHRVFSDVLWNEEFMTPYEV